jgi:hypothetical protein
VKELNRREATGESKNGQAKGFMTVGAELARLSANRFAALILDNEVTVGHFVASPPLPWTRLTRRDGSYRAAEGYPSLLTAEQAKFEMRNWDEVSPQGIMRALKELDDRADYVLIGNNAGQGLPLARSLPQNLTGGRAAIIYGESLPEIKEYGNMGYRTFFRRSESIPHLLRLATSAGRPPALFFINTIQHNELNYHNP